MIENLSAPPAVSRIARTLEGAGFETWCVGGAVRDALLGQTHLDWDLATAAHPEQVRRLFARTVPIGIAFGTVGVLDEAGVMHEVTTFRRDVRTDGRHAVVEFGATLEEDLARRDYTINAIAFHPATREVRDPFEGKKDLAMGIVRAVGDPRERMREDRLRALRAIRFASRFGFTIDPPTWDSIVASAPHFTRLSPERVKQEIEKTMDQVRCPGFAFAMWQSSGAFSSLIPPLADAGSAALATIDHLAMPVPPRAARVSGGLVVARPNRRILRLIALFAAAPAGTALDLLKALRFSNADAAWISTVIGHWHGLDAEMRFAFQSPPVADAVLRRWAAITGRTRLASVLRLGAARWAAEGAASVEAPDPPAVHSTYRRAIRIAYRDPVEIADLAVDGRDLEKLGLRGPAVGTTLRKLLEMVITEPSANDRQSLLSAVRRELHED